MPQYRHYVVQTREDRGTKYQLAWDGDLKRSDINRFITEFNIPGPGFGRGFGRCIYIERDSNDQTTFSARPGPSPSLKTSAPSLHGMGACTGLESVEQSELTVLDSPDYHTERTVLVSYLGEMYIAKSHDTAEDASHNHLKTECITMSRLDHPHIAKPYRLVNSGDGFTAFLLKYQPNGNVQEYILVQQRYNHDRRLDLLYKWPVQLASTLEYLCQTRTSYENVKLLNCLVDEAEDLLLIDFDQGQYSAGTAPEISSGEVDFEDELNSSSDVAQRVMVYRWATTVKRLWETTVLDPTPFHCVYFDQAAEIIAERDRVFVRDCIKGDPRKRPLFADVKRHFAQREQGSKEVSGDDVVEEK